MRLTILLPLLILAGAIGVFADTDGLTALLTAFHAPAWAGWVLSFLIGSGVLGVSTKIAMAFRDLINHVFKLIEIIRRENVSNEAKAEANGVLDNVMFIMSKVPLPYIKSKIPFVQSMKLKFDAIPSAPTTMYPTSSQGVPIPPIPLTVPSIPVTEPLVVEKKDTMESGNALAGILLLGLLLFGAVQTQAKEIFIQPFTYFLTPKFVPAGYNCLDTAVWSLKPEITVPILQMRSSTLPDAKLDVSTVASAGGGITYERDVIVNGKNYSTMSVSIVELLATNPPGVNPDFAVGIVGGMFNNILQAGIGYDFGAVTNGHRVFLMVGFGITLARN